MGKPTFAGVGGKEEHEPIPAITLECGAVKRKEGPPVIGVPLAGRGRLFRSSYSNRGSAPHVIARSFGGRTTSWGSVLYDGSSREPLATLLMDQAADQGAADGSPLTALGRMRFDENGSTVGPALA